MIDKLKTYVTESPCIQTAVFFVSVIVSGFLSGALVTEITVNGKINWWLIPQKASFYLIIVLLFVVYLYNKILHEEQIERYKDEEYLKALYNRKVMPEMSNKVGELIRSSKSIKELEDIDSFNKKILK